MYRIIRMNVGDVCTWCAYRWGRREFAVLVGNSIGPDDTIRVMEHLVTMYPVEDTNGGVLCMWRTHRWIRLVPLSFRPHVVDASTTLLSTYIVDMDNVVCTYRSEVGTVW